MARAALVRGVEQLCPSPAGQVHCHLPEFILARGGIIKEYVIEHRARKGGRAKFGALNRVVPGFVSLLQARAAVRSVCRRS